MIFAAGGRWGSDRASRDTSRCCPGYRLGRNITEPILIQSVSQTLYSQDLKLVSRAAPGDDASLRMSPQVCL